MCAPHVFYVRMLRDFQTKLSVITDRDKFRRVICACKLHVSPYCTSCTTTSCRRITNSCILYRILTVLGNARRSRDIALVSGADSQVHTQSGPGRDSSCFATIATEPGGHAFWGCRSRRPSPPQYVSHSTTRAKCYARHQARCHGFHEASCRPLIELCDDEQCGRWI